MRSYTVHSIVHELLGFLLCKASDFGARQLVGSFADKVVRLLRDCGDAALDAVAATSGDTAGADVAPTTAIEAAKAPPVAQSSSVPATGVATIRPLKSLTVEEVGHALAALELDKLIPIFAANKVTGKLLASCDEVSELMSEDVGVPTKLIAKMLLEQIEEWKTQGVSGL
jgi:hypothetical protein